MRKVSLLLAIGTMITVVVARPSAALPGSWRDSNTTRVVARQSAPATPSKSADKKEADCGCEVKAPPDVLAIVNGVKVMIKDVDEPIKDRVLALQNQVIEARKHQLDVEINARLLEGEAARLGTTEDKLLEREVATKIKQPTEADARTFYE